MTNNFREKANLRLAGSRLYSTRAGLVHSERKLHVILLFVVLHWLD